jgi:hypothetical protein
MRNIVGGMILSMEGSIRRISCRLLASRTGTGTGRVSADKGTWVHVHGGGEVGLESFCGKHKTEPAEWVLREEKRVDCRLLRERESEDLTVLIYTRQKTSERTNDITQQKTIERHDESRRLSDKSKETSRTTGNLENSHDRPVLPPRTHRNF